MRDADDPDAASMVAEAQLVPRALRSLLPNSDPEVGRRKLGGEGRTMGEEKGGGGGG